MTTMPTEKEDGAVENCSEAEIPGAAQSESEQSSGGSQPSESEPWLLRHAREVFEAQVVLYDPKTLDKLPEAVVMEHYLLLGSTIRSKKEEYAQGDKYHGEWKSFILGLI